MPRPDDLAEWTVADVDHVVYVGSTATEPHDQAFFLAPPGPADEAPEAAGAFTGGRVFEAELDEEHREVVPIPGREWVADSEDELRAIIEDVREEIDPDTFADVFRRLLAGPDSTPRGR